MSNLNVKDISKMLNILFWSKGTSESFTKSSVLFHQKKREPNISRTWKKQKSDSDSQFYANLAKKIDVNNRNATFSAKLAEGKYMKAEISSTMLKKLNY